MIRKMGKRWAVVHCHGQKKGQIIASFPTRKKALAMHRAIEVSKARRHKTHL